MEGDLLAIWKMTNKISPVPFVPWESQPISGYYLRYFHVRDTARAIHWARESRIGGLRSPPSTSIRRANRVRAKIPETQSPSKISSLFQKKVFLGSVREPETQHTRADRARESDEALTERRNEVTTDSEPFIQETMTSAEAAAEAPRVSDRAQTAGIEKSKDAPEFADADRDARTTPTSAHATGVKAREGQVESSDSDSNQDGERNGVKHGDEGRRHGEGAKKVSLCSRTTTRHNARNVPTLPNPEHARPPRCDVVIDAFVDPDESTRLSWVWIRSERGRRTSTARQPSAFPAARLPSCFSLVGSERFGRARYFSCTRLDRKTDVDPSPSPTISAAR